HAPDASDERAVVDRQMPAYEDRELSSGDPRTIAAQHAGRRADVVQGLANTPELRARGHRRAWRRWSTVGRRHDRISIEATEREVDDDWGCLVERRQHQRVVPDDLRPRTSHVGMIVPIRHG